MIAFWAFYLTRVFFFWMVIAYPHFLNFMNVCFLSIIVWTKKKIFFFLNIGFTLDSSMIEVVFIHPFEFCELFYKYNSSLGLATLFPQLHSSLDLEDGFTFHPWSLTFYSSKKSDCYSWRPTQHEIFMYAFLCPWVGLMH